MTAAEVRDRLREACAAAGSQQAFAAQAGVTASYVSDVLLGRREPTDAVLAPLGLERVVSYQPSARLFWTSLTFRDGRPHELLTPTGGVPWSEAASIARTYADAARVANGDVRIGRVA